MRSLIFYYNPRSRAATARWMLEEVGADYEIRLLDFEAGDNRKAEFLAVNPMGKVPAIVTPEGAVITETAAIIAWLADSYPKAGLAPAVGTAERGVYYRWLFFGAGVFEPAVVEAMMRADQPKLPKSAVGWGSYDDVVDTLEGALSKTHYLIGDAFSAADVYLGSQLAWTSSFGAPRLKESRPIMDYIARVTAREAYKRSLAPA